MSELLAAVELASRREQVGGLVVVLHPDETLRS